uniref:Uncharacterized protein n=1 Tax=Rhizophora mucronata TaxID=61149 RepID=A0A2P2IWY7_RHIMU
MVVDTVFPGPGDDHATVSTRLFLPPKKVKEKARKLESSLAEDLVSGSTSQNILAITFRQVVLQQLWNFELLVFRPGSERNMEDLENPREVPASFIVSSTNENVISMLAEAICNAALRNTEAHYLDKYMGKSVDSSFNWFQRPRKIASTDHSVTIYKLVEDEIIENAKSLLENFNLTKQDHGGIKLKQNYNWWPSLVCSKLEKIGGPEFRTWTSEYVPAYRLQIDAAKFKDVKFDGWKKTAENRWEIFLTHSQMVGLAEILDMFYEDRYSLPNKKLLCGVVTKFDGLSNKKRSPSFVSSLSMIIASGVFLISIAGFGQFCTHLHRGQKYTQLHRSSPPSEIQYPINEALDATKLQEFCVLIVKKIKDAFGWPADIVTEERNGAWIGKIPDYLKMTSGTDSNSAEYLIDSIAMGEMDENMKSSAQTIASYEVVLSTDGKIVGFQPTSRTGVNHWAANPLAKELYGGRKLRPGFLEPGLKMRLPKEVAVIELLMSTNSDGQFALARPLR